MRLLPTGIKQRQECQGARGSHRSWVSRGAQNKDALCWRGSHGGWVPPDAQESARRRGIPSRVSSMCKIWMLERAGHLGGEVRISDIVWLACGII